MKVKALILAAVVTMVWVGDSQAASKFTTVKINRLVYECRVRTTAEGLVKLKPKPLKTKAPKQDHIRLQRSERSVILGACFEKLTEQLFTSASSNSEVAQ